MMLNSLNPPHTLLNDQHRPNVIQLPPRPRPSSSTFVFTSSRSSHLSSPPTPAAVDTDPYSPHMPSVATLEPTTSRSKARVSLSEHQLLRHGQGASDLRTQLVLAKTPPGFIPLSESSPPVPVPKLGPPPTFDPSENPFFPPLVFVGVPRASLSPPAESLAPRARSETSASWTTYDPCGDRPQSASSSTTLVSSPDLTGALVRSTDVRVNSGAPVSRQSSTAGCALLGRKAKELSLTELFAGDCVATRFGGSAPRVVPPRYQVASRQSLKENGEGEKPRKGGDKGHRERDGKKERRARRAADKDEHLSSSDSDWMDKKPKPGGEARSRRASLEHAARIERKLQAAASEDSEPEQPRASPRKDRDAKVRTKHVRPRVLRH